MKDDPFVWYLIFILETLILLLKQSIIRIKLPLINYHVIIFISVQILVILIFVLTCKNNDYIYKLKEVSIKYELDYPFRKYTLEGTLELIDLRTVKVQI